MDLWIRSQDRNSLIKVNEINIFDEYTKKQETQNYMPKDAKSYDDMQTVTAYVNDKFIKSIILINGNEIASYKSKERALEVLDEIQDILNPDIKPIIGKSEFIQLNTYVYEMPKD